MLIEPDTSALSGTPPAAVAPDDAPPEPDADADALADGDVAADPDAAAELEAGAELAGATADEDAAAELAGAVDAAPELAGAGDAPPPLPAHAARIMLTTVSSAVIRHHEPCLFAFIAVSFLFEPNVGRKTSALAHAGVETKTAQQAVPLYRAQELVTLGKCTRICVLCRQHIVQLQHNGFVA